jgi:hypothetical protein
LDQIDKSTFLDQIDKGSKWNIANLWIWCRQVVGVWKKNKKKFFWYLFFLKRESWLKTLLFPRVIMRMSSKIITTTLPCLIFINKIAEKKEEISEWKSRRLVFFTRRVRVTFTFFSLFLIFILFFALYFLGKINEMEGKRWREKWLINK